MKIPLFGLFSLIVHVSIPQLLGGESANYGAQWGWDDTIYENLQETKGWRGMRALTLAPLERRPKSDWVRTSIDLLLLAEAQGLENLAGRYRVDGSYEVSQHFFARGRMSFRPGPNGLELHPSSNAMWAPGTEWNDFTLDFHLRPSFLRDGEIFFAWEGQTANGIRQSVTAVVKKRRLVWSFDGFFRRDTDRFLNIKLTSSPLIPGKWGHHRIRYNRDNPTFKQSGASPGLLEYLVDDVPTAMVHTTPHGTESSLPFYPRIGKLSDSPIRIAPNFKGYIDEFRLISSYDFSSPPMKYSNRERAARGRGRTNSLDSGYSGSTLSGVRVRAELPGTSRIRVYALAMDRQEDIWMAGMPAPEQSEWIPLNMEEEPEDPGGYGQWYTWDGEASVRGRYFLVGYILDPDPGADVAPVLSALEITFKPRKPPRPPRNLRWTRAENDRVQISWSEDAEIEVAGWWLSWGSMPESDVSSTEWGGKESGYLWIARDSGGMKPEILWPEGGDESIIYITVRAAWQEGAPDEMTGEPKDYRALSIPSNQISFHP